MNEYGDTSPYSAFTKHHPLQMNRIITLLLFIVTFATASAEKGTPALFARILPDRTTLIAGDSMLVSVVLYAQHPIAEAECNSTFKVTGKNGGKCTYRRLNIDRNSTAGRTREGGKVYYTLVWNQYVVAPNSVGRYSIPPLKFTATLQQVVRMPDLFDQMMGASPEYKEHKEKGTSETFTFEAKEKPRRSTQEILRSGGTML